MGRNKKIRNYEKTTFGTFANAMRMIGVGEAVAFSIEHMNGIRSEVSRQKILNADKDWKTEINKESRTIRVWRTA
jgi:hypothetical protein